MTLVFWFFVLLLPLIILLLPKTNAAAPPVRRFSPMIRTTRTRIKNESGANILFSPVRLERADMDFIFWELRVEDWRVKSDVFWRLEMWHEYSQYLLHAKMAFECIILKDLGRQRTSTDSRLVLPHPSRMLLAIRGHEDSLSSARIRIGFWN